jgi:hypothetical protein
MSRAARSVNGYLFVALAAAIAAACSQGDQGVVQAQPDDPVISLSEGPCTGPCPVYDMTLHPNGAYVLNSVRFVKGNGVTEGSLGRGKFAAAEKVLEDAGFWTLKPEQTMETLPNCHTGAPTTTIIWRTETGREKTVTYNAGCGVAKMQNLVAALRDVLGFERLVWTDEQFGPSGNR